MRSFSRGSADLGFKELERFVAVVERGGLAEAAKTLGITQQALGRSLTKLETALGAKLVHRAQGSQTRPTLYGDAFLQYAKSQINGMAQAMEHMQALAGARAGSVVLGIGESCDASSLAAAVRDFHARTPDVEVSLIEGYTESLLEQLLEGDLDCVVGTLPDARDTHRGLVHEPLYSISDIVVARPEHPVMRIAEPTLADLQPFTWLVARRRASDWLVIRDAFLAAGLEPPQRVIRSDAAMVGTRLMLADDFLIMLSPTLVDSGSANPLLRRVPIDQPTVLRHVGLLTVAQRQLNPATEQLIDLLRERLDGSARRTLALAR